MVEQADTEGLNPSGLTRDGSGPSASTISFARGRWAPATQEAYALAWADYQRFCEGRGEPSLPVVAQTVADYLRELATTRSTATLSQRLAAIVAVSVIDGNPLRVNETMVRDAWAEIRRQKGTARQPKQALTVADVRKIIRQMPEDAVRDRAVILFAEASLMRRSEIVALDYSDLEFTEDALLITVRRSKTDKEGKGERVAILRQGTEFGAMACAAVRALLDQIEITEGAVFRNRRGRMAAREVATIGKRWAANAGYDPKLIGAHSFRRGGITTMFRNGAKIEDIMRASRHKTVGIALGYVEGQHASRNPALVALG